jgi:acetate kinase
MLVLAVNSGSTSAKLAAFASADGGATFSRVRYEHLSGAALDPHAALAGFLAKLDGSVAAAAHRVVHGGSEFVRPIVIDARVEAALRALCELAPLHNPPALEWIEAARSACGPATRQIAAFDTAFFADLPRVAHEYALPPSLGTDVGVRRYGFHGLAHEAMWQRWCELHPEHSRGGRLITLQLGGGCSVAAIDAGHPLDTSMGFSPLEGLVMATRSGDLDPAAVAYLARKLGATPDRIVERLNREAGLLGVSGSTSDMWALAREEREAARFAIELYCYRVRKYLGAYLAVLGGCDGIVFGGGVGENMPQIRERILASLGWAGIRVDARANRGARGAEACISEAASAVAIHVIPVDEESSLAGAAFALTAPQGA